MFKILNFQTYRIFTNDVEETKDWYRKFFEMEPVENLPNFVSFNINGVLFDISEADDRSTIGGSVGYWRIDDMAAMIKRAKELGGKVYRGPLRVEETQRTIVQIIDPYGNIVGFEEDFGN